MSISSPYFLSYSIYPINIIWSFNNTICPLRTKHIA
nr:MAG TPA: hypothetical protein [Bacteriophage sp.]